MDSKTGLIIQLAGVSLITLLTMFLRRSLEVVALKHWTNAWLFLACSLFCLRLAFGYESYSLQLMSFYFLSGYIFGFLLIVGCRSLGRTSELPFRQEILILPFILIAFGLPFVSNDLALVLNIHSLLLSGFLVVAFIELWKAQIKSFGWKVMLVALALLTVDHCQNFVAFAVRHLVNFPPEFLEYNAIVDLVLQMLLGFGMVIVLLELVLKDAKVANEKLKKAHEKLEKQAHIDPLTAALNRHAFHGYVNRDGDYGDQNQTAGTVGFFDIDDLKTINDDFGHTVGDIAIRAVVRAIRQLIRAEDLIFRWGGDEFFVLMIGLNARTATLRMERLEDLLSNIQLGETNRPISVRVSYAFADFDDISDLEETIAKADAMMYREKQIRKGIAGTDFIPRAQIAGNARTAS